MGRRISYTDVADGVNDTAAPGGIGPRQLRGGLNVNSDEMGSIAERLGAEQYGNTIGTGSGILGLDYYEEYDGTITPIAIFGTDVYLLSGATWTAQSQTLTATKKAQFVNAFDEIYLFNGTDNVRYYGGSSWTEIATFPKGSMGCFHENRICTAGVAGNEDTLYYGDFGTNTHTSTNTVSVERPIKQIIAGDLYLYIFTERDIYRFAKFEDFGGVAVGPDKLEKLPAHVGTASLRSAIKMGGCLTFAARAGVYRSDGFDRILISAEARGTYEGLDLDELDEACAVEFNNKYWLAVRDSGESYNNKVMVFDTKVMHQAPTGELIPAFWPYEYTEIYPAVFKVIPTSTGENRLYAGDESTGKVWRLETGTNDDDGVIDSYAEKAILYETDPDFQKTLKRVQGKFATLGEYDIKMGWKSDEYSDQGYFEETKSLAAKSITRDKFVRGEEIRGVSNTKTVFIEPYARGTGFTIRMRNANADEPWKCRGIHAAFSTRRRYDERD